MVTPTHTSVPAGSILVDTMSGLSEVQFPALSEVTQSFVVKNNSALLGLTLPELETIGTSLELVGNPALLAVTATALNFVNQGFRFQGSGNLQGVELGMLQIGFDSSCDAEVCGLVIEDIGFADGEPTEAQVFLPFLAATTSLDLINTELTTLPFFHLGWSAPPLS